MLRLFKTTITNKQSFRNKFNLNSNHFSFIHTKNLMESSQTGKTEHANAEKAKSQVEEEKKELPSQEESKNEDVVTPFTVSAGTNQGINYDKLIEKFGCSHITPQLIEWFEKDAFDVPVIIQLTDDEKFIHNPKLKLEQCSKYGIENAKDIIAVGFDVKKTFIFNDTDYVGHMYENIVKLQRHTTLNQIKAIFGFNESENVGKFAFPAVQAAPSFSGSFKHIFGNNTKVPCLIPQGIDQDPYFRLTRDVASKLKLFKPAVIHSKFFPALQGFLSKMSGSDPNSAIFCTDTPNQIKNKINKYAFSGGQDTAEKQRELGANLEIDVSYNYLKYFLDDDEEFEEIGRKYSKGEMLTGEIKARLIKLLQELVRNHQEARKKVTPEMIKEFMSIRPLQTIPKGFQEQE